MTRSFTQAPRGPRSHEAKQSEAPGSGTPLAGVSGPSVKDGLQHSESVGTPSRFKDIFPRHDDNVPLARNLLGNEAPEWLVDATAAFYDILHLKLEGTSLRRAPKGSALAEFAERTALDRIETVVPESVPWMAKGIVSWLHETGNYTEEMTDCKGGLPACIKMAQSRISEAWALHKLLDPGKALPRKPDMLTRFLSAVKEQPLLLQPLAIVPPAATAGTLVALMRAGVAMKPETPILVMVTAMGLTAWACFRVFFLIRFEDIAASALRRKASMLLSSRNLHGESEIQLRRIAANPRFAGQRIAAIKALEGGEQLATVHLLTRILKASTSPAEKEALQSALAIITERLERYGEKAHCEFTGRELSLSLLRVPPDLLARRASFPPELPAERKLRLARRMVDRLPGCQAA